MKPVDYVRETIDLVNQIESRFLELGARLYRIKEERLWSDSYSSYHEFLEAARINPALATIFASIHRKYIVEGGVSPSTLVGIGYTNLYEAIPLIESDGIDKVVVKASTLTRSEIKDEVRDDKHGEHAHNVGKERWGKCDTCGKFIRLPDCKEE